jgi:hypothetical protein
MWPFDIKSLETGAVAVTAKETEIGGRKLLPITGH